MCLALPAQERCAIWPVPERLNWAQCGFGHEKRVYLSGAGVVRNIALLLWQGTHQKLQRQRQVRHVTIPTATLLEHALLPQGLMGVSKVAFPRRLQLQNRNSTGGNLSNAIKCRCRAILQDYPKT